MAAYGIPIDAITIQNEPLNPKNNPSMVMEASEQGDFIKNNLGPEFKAAKIKTASDFALSRASLSTFFLNAALSLGKI